MSSKLLRGTFILTLGTIISKLLGLFYVIPFVAIVGTEGTGLYQYAYVPYTIFLSFATAGVPLAVSKFVAKYNAMEEYAVGRRLFKSGLVVMLTTGIIAFLILFIFAPAITNMFTIDPKYDFSKEEVVTVIRAVSFALIIIPFMSLIRGFFQGHQSMGPSAVSQVIEQIARILFLLIGAFIVLYVLDGSLVTAISVATFAAFIGGIASLAVLVWYWMKRKPHLDKLLERDRGTVNISFSEMYKEIIFYSIPFVMVGISNSLYQFVDLTTFKRAMFSIGLAEEAQHALTIVNFTTHKLVIIPVSLATAFSLTLVPMITHAFVQQDRKSVNHQLNQMFQVLLFLTLPASLGISLLAEPVYTVFYGHDALGADILRIYAPVAVLFALFSVTAAVLQGINEQRWTILSLLTGLLVKLSFNIPLIERFETEGAIMATALGYSVAVLINLSVIKYFVGYKYRLVLRRTLLIVIFCAIMLAAAGAVYKLSELILSPAARGEALIMILFSAAFGAGLYFYLSWRSKLALLLFGSKIERLIGKLPFKKKRPELD